jgi:hypothetical protein
VIFANAANADTNATFSASGTYVLRLQASDGALSRFDELRVTVDLAAITRSFQDGVFPTSSYFGTRDTQIRSSTPDSNTGRSNSLDVDGDPDAATLLKWDLSSIPLGSRVAAAAISLNVVNTSRDTYQVFQLKRPWTETDATWTRFDAGSLWELPGAQGQNDRGSQSLGSVTASAIGATVIQLNSAGIAILQSWIDNPSSNFGVTIQNYVGPTDGLVISSRENVTTGSRPKLMLTYTTS